MEQAKRRLLPKAAKGTVFVPLQYEKNLLAHYGRMVNSN
jgi:hypothetical protein